MVSTRGIKFKFSEGERVLCYEPDPTKAKVLYESKVLDVVISRDNRGRKIPEYLIHFNGWSSTWDRCVTEEFVLKDNDENRVLQRRLAELAAINLKSKKQKRGLSEILKDSPGSGSVNNNKKKSVSDEDSEEGWAKGSSADSNTSHSTCSSMAGGSDDDDDNSRKLELPFPEVLSKSLEDVHKLIKERGRLVGLPCSPNVIAILEGYVKNYTANTLCVTPEKPNMNRSRTPSEKHMNICKEVVDGVRIYFDFMLPTVLLYDEERAQYKHFNENYKPLIVPTTDEINMKMPLAGSPPASKRTEIERESCSEVESLDVAPQPKDVNSSQDCHASPQSAKSLLPLKTPKNEPLEETPEVGQTRRVLRSTASRLEVASKCQAAAAASPRPLLSARAPHDFASAPPASASEPVPTTKSKECKGAKSARHHTATGHTSSGRSTGSTPGSPSASSFQTAGFPSLTLSSQHQATDLPPLVRRKQVPTPLSIPGHISSISSSSSPSGPSTPTANIHASDVSDALHQALMWQMVPHSVCLQTPPPPSLIYGGQHLLRLFVKLPELLTRSNISDYKLEVIHSHLHLFLKYLADFHDDLFTHTEVSNEFEDVRSSEAATRSPTEAHCHR